MLNTSVLRATLVLEVCATHRIGIRAILRLEVCVILKLGIHASSILRILVTLIKELFATPN